MNLSVQPCGRFNLVADEIISMLDASTRIDVLNLLGDLKARGLGVLFITHDLSLGNYISEKTVILRRGAVVEMGATGKVFGNPVHPYTRMLIVSVPQLHRKWDEVAEELRLHEASLDPRCVYHELLGSGGSPGAENAGRPALAEAEADHYVACFQLKSC